MDAKIETIESICVASVRRNGPYGPEICGEAFNALAVWAEPLGYFRTGQILALYWDNPETTPPGECRMDACVGVPENTSTTGEVKLQTVRGGPYAVCRFEITTEEFSNAWEEAFGWVMSQGYELLELPCFERYYNNAATHPKNKWIVDLCFPLKEVS